jgi:hypothetical protein
MNQINEKNTNPTNPISRMSATPMPFPALHAEPYVPVQCVLDAPAMIQMMMIALQPIRTQVILRQCGLRIASCLPCVAA